MKLTTRIIIKLYSPDNRKLLHKLVLKAPKHNTYTELAVKNQIAHLQKRLDEKLPNHHYKVYAHSKEEFRFYWDSAFKLSKEEIEDFYRAYNDLVAPPENSAEVKEQ